MALNMTLEIIGGALEIGDPSSKVFDAAGGRIGRGLDCDWVLSDGHVSRHHASVWCVDDVFYIESLGANGVAVNSQDRLSRHERCVLKDGDKLFLDEYEICVSIADTTAAQAGDCKVPGDYKVPPEEDVLAQLLPLPPEQAVPEAGAFDATAFLKGLGLEPLSWDARAAGTLGQIVRATLQGLLEVQQARSGLESQPHARETLEVASSNNPLKTAGSVEDALRALLGTPQPKQLAPLEALEDALGDIRFHPLAVQAGMRASFERFTRRFEPVRLMAQANHGRRQRLSGLAAKARYWDGFLGEFEEVILELELQVEDSYQEVFFDAYRRRLGDLKRHQGGGAAA